MNADRFDALARSLLTGVTRRRVAGGMVAIVAGSFLPLGSAANKHKKKTTLVRNQFGCVNVGGTCKGKDANCCSGICQGKKPKKGKKDTRRCVGHHEDACSPDRNFCVQDLANIAPARCNAEQSPGGLHRHYRRRQLLCELVRRLTSGQLPGLHEGHRLHGRGLPARLGLRPVHRFERVPRELPGHRGPPLSAGWDLVGAVGGWWREGSEPVCSGMSALDSV